mmetsp:Transcript_13969/g.21129  ORF Transcript_13969/g.21129 Transcript_13969/m.21129 type:complete len:473 (-) Transcript_13969:226-1644(-)
MNLEAHSAEHKAQDVIEVYNMPPTTTPFSSEERPEIKPSTKNDSQSEVRQKRPLRSQKVLTFPRTVHAVVSRYAFLHEDFKAIVANVKTTISLLEAYALPKKRKSSGNIQSDVKEEAGSDASKTSTTVHKAVAQDINDIDVNGVLRGFKTNDSKDWVDHLQLLQTVHIRNLVDKQETKQDGEFKKAYWLVFYDVLDRARNSLTQIRSDLHWLKDIEDFKESSNRIEETIQKSLKSLGKALPDAGLSARHFQRSPRTWLKTLLKIEIKKTDPEAHLSLSIQWACKVLTGSIKITTRRSRSPRRKPIRPNSPRHRSHAPLKGNRNDQFSPRISSRSTAMMRGRQTFWERLKDDFKRNASKSPGRHRGTSKTFKKVNTSAPQLQTQLKVNTSSTLTRPKMPRSPSLRSRGQAKSQGNKNSLKFSSATFSPRISKKSAKMMQGRKSFWDRVAGTIVDHNDRMQRRRAIAASRAALS